MSESFDYSSRHRCLNNSQSQLWRGNNSLGMQRQSNLWCNLQCRTGHVWSVICCVIDRLFRRWVIQQQCSVISWSSKSVKCMQHLHNKLCRRPPHNMPRPLQVDLWPLTLKVVSESCVTWATSVPILVFLSLSVLDLGPMYATYRETSHRRQMRIIALCPPPPRTGA